MCLTIPVISKNYTKANKSIVRWLNGLQVSIRTIYYIYTKYTQALQITPGIKHKDNSSQDNIVSRESINGKEDKEDKEGKGQDSV